MTTLVLTYHSCNISGNDYSCNDHIALEQDLKTIYAQGFQVISLADAVAAGLSGRSGSFVALTFDDGPIFDFEDFIHPQYGHQKSFTRILQEFNTQTDATATASSFVIASPIGRKQMDQKDYGERDWWHDRWWKPAIESGQLTIENHSWDHNHRAIDPSAHKYNQRGGFEDINTEAECELEIRKSSEYIRSVTARTPKFFAYPWGQSSDYLRSIYLPKIGPEIGLDAAFSIVPKAITPDCNRWFLPRFVCGDNWQSANGLKSILETSA
ncbi:MAG: polysaccharide deacetylase family protein [Xanthomonadales bacterium]|nr:polysaccharide deacetylase family protein [Xanthomonadales bacterium]